MNNIGELNQKLSEAKLLTIVSLYYIPRYEVNDELTKIKESVSYLEKRIAKNVKLELKRFVRVAEECSPDLKNNKSWVLEKTLRGLNKQIQ